MAIEQQRADTRAHVTLAQSMTKFVDDGEQQTDRADRRTELAADRTVVTATRTYVARARTGLVMLAGIWGS
jgi:putative membrane protein